jgi:hypothetical protein
MKEGDTLILMFELFFDFRVNFVDCLRVLSMI